ncbi:MAG: hypothetical protein JOZ62_01985 [Acidobacteriaceae bacterium]|nr:hypothetical protein [Acidobacteriaceae bacterium]
MILDELDATIAAVSSIIPGEIVVTSSDGVDEIVQWLRERGAEPVSNLEMKQLTGRAALVTTAA